MSLKVFIVIGQQRASSGPVWVLKIRFYRELGGCTCLFSYRRSGVAKDDGVAIGEGTRSRTPRALCGCSFFLYLDENAYFRAKGAIQVAPPPSLVSPACRRKTGPTLVIINASNTSGGKKLRRS
jgi:hypothetical protein